MQIITRGKTPRSNADVPPGCQLPDAVHQDHIEKKVQTTATFERLLRKLAEKAGRICEQHHLPEDSTWTRLTPTAKKPSLPSKGMCINARTTLRSTFFLEKRDARTSQLRRTSFSILQ